jgi:proteic killer suppression protein
MNDPFVRRSAMPRHRLEPLRGSRAGSHSIRINDQWRLCFVWKDGGAERVAIVDYHQG